MKILMIAGSNRKMATSTRLCKYIQQEIMQLGHVAELFDLYKYPVPFYTPENKEIPDEHLLKLKKAAVDADAIILSTPEYHGTVSGVLKNALDHLGKDHFDGKVVLSVSSAGGDVGVSSLQELQTIVRNLHGINCTEWISIGGDHRRFTPEGVPESGKIKDRVHRTVRYFLKMAGVHAAANGK